MDAWNEVCVNLSRKARERARRQTPPIADDWDARCMELAKRGSNLPQPYQPSERCGIILTSDGYGRFEHESAPDTEWRDASNRMKRAGDLWYKRAASRADPWGPWCAGRGASPDRTGFKRKTD